MECEGILGPGSHSNQRVHNTDRATHPRQLLAPY